MRDAKMVKVELYDLTVRTLFSTAAKQIGYDKSRNACFRAALQGLPISELTHLDQFRSFDQMIAGRDERHEIEW